MIQAITSILLEIWGMVLLACAITVAVFGTIWGCQKVIKDLFKRG